MPCKHSYIEGGVGVYEYMCPTVRTCYSANNFPNAHKTLQAYCIVYTFIKKDSHTESLLLEKYLQYKNTNAN